MRQKFNLIAVMTTMFLAACGGGGGGATATPTTPSPTVTQITTTTLFDSSYENMKGQGLLQLDFSGINAGQITSAWAIGNFFGDGSVIVMVSRSNSLSCYSNSNGTTTINPTCLGAAPRYIKDDKRVTFEFYKLTSPNTLVNTGRTVTGCLTPRKAVVADFNRDGSPDIFVACHGWDGEINGQWPGEPSKLLINDGHGNFTASDVGATDRNADGSGYYHGASAADVNGDGFPDVVLTDNFRAAGKNITVLINQRTTPVSFAVEDNRIGGQSAGPYFSVELFDADKDGKIDIIAGGNEQPSGNADTVILYGDGAGNFGTRKTVITALPGLSGPLDFTYIDKAADERVIMVHRQDAYATQGVQAYNVKTGLSTVVWTDTAGSDWVEWWLPVTKNGVKGIVPYANTRKATAFVKP